MRQQFIKKQKKHGMFQFVRAGKNVFSRWPSIEVDRSRACERDYSGAV